LRSIHTTGQFGLSDPLDLTAMRRSRPRGARTSSTIGRTSRASDRHRWDGVGASSGPSFRSVPSDPFCGPWGLRHWPP